jgi:DNA-binding transcriptional LysR family regulator
VRVGEIVDQSLVVRRLGAVNMVTVASPGFIANTPVHNLGDLPFVTTIAYRIATTGRERPWHFRLEGRAVEWSPRAQLVLDGGEAMVEAAIAGAGVAQIPHWMASDALSRGDLVEVLAPLRPPPLPIHAIHLGGRKLAPRTRAFLDFLVKLPAWRKRSHS